LKGKLSQLSRKPGRIGIKQSTWERQHMKRILDLFNFNLLINQPPKKVPPPPAGTAINPTTK